MTFDEFCQEMRKKIAGAMGVPEEVLSVSTPRARSFAREVERMRRGVHTLYMRDVPTLSGSEREVEILKVPPSQYPDAT